MLSDELRALCAVFSRRTTMFDGQVFLDVKQSEGVIGLLNALAEQAERLECQVVPPSARCIPDGVIDFQAARRVAVAPTGGNAA
jgi:hypothetical protein